MLLAHPLTLPGGLRVRVRLPLTTDAAAIVALLARLGLAADELDVRRALRFDPRTRTVLVATAFADGHEVVLGVAGGAREADTVLAQDPAVARVLEAAVRERAASRAA